MKTCMKCKVLKPNLAFQKHTHTKDRLRHECRDCTSKYQKVQRVRYRGATSRRYNLKKLFGITTEQYDKMLHEQGGKCAICRTDQSGTERSTYLCVDHDHETGKVRGLLCVTCNMGLGMFKDNVGLMAKAIDYLASSKEK